VIRPNRGHEEAVLQLRVYPNAEYRPIRWTNRHRHHASTTSLRLLSPLSHTNRFKLLQV